MASEKVAPVAERKTSRFPSRVRRTTARLVPRGSRVVTRENWASGWEMKRQFPRGRW